MSQATKRVPKEEDCILFVKTLQGSVIRGLSEVLKDLIYESSFIVSPQGIKITTMDTTKSSLVYLNLLASNFEEFTCTQSEFRLGISMVAFHRLLKTTGNKDMVTLFVKKDRVDELGIATQNNDKKTRSIFFLKMLELDGNNISLPDIDFSSVATLPSASFQRLCRDMLHIGSDVTLATENNEMIFHVSGEFASQTTVMGSEDSSDITVSSSCDALVDGKFSLKYLCLFSKATNLSPVVTIYLKNKTPLVLEYMCSLGSLKFLLTPVVEDAEDDDE